MTFGENLETILEEKGLNMHKLAEISGVSYNTIYSLVKRNSNKVSYSVLSKLAYALNLKPHDLLTDEEDTLRAALREYNDVLKKEKQKIDRREKAVMTAFRKLNEDGQDVAIDRVKELTEIPRYQKEQKEKPQAAAEPSEAQ